MPTLQLSMEPERRARNGRRVAGQGGQTSSLNQEAQTTSPGILRVSQASQPTRSGEVSTASSDESPNLPFNPRAAKTGPVWGTEEAENQPLTRVPTNPSFSAPF